MNGEARYLETLARYSHDIRTGNLHFDYRTGQCAPMGATNLVSWGPGCPPGWCPPDKLPEQLGRYFAGERNSCKELPISFANTTTAAAAASTAVTITGTSRVTFCPTRLIVDTIQASRGQWQIDSIQFGNQNQIVGGPVYAEAFAPGAFQVVPMVPDCLRAGQPYTINLTLGLDAGTADASIWLVFIGPMVG